MTDATPQTVFYHHLAEQSALFGGYLIQHGRLLYVNAAFAEIFQYTPTECLALESFLTLIYPEERPLIVDNLRRRLAGEAIPSNYVTRGQRKDGTIIYIEIRSFRTTYQGESAVVGTVLDVTEHRHLEQQIQTLLERRTRQVHLATLIAKETMAAQDLKDFYQRIISHVREQFNFYQVSIFRYIVETRQLEWVAGAGPLDGGNIAHHKLIELAAESGMSILRSRLLTDSPIKSLLAIPIKPHVGILVVQSNILEGLDSEDQFAMEGIAEQFAVAIENIQLSLERQRTDIELRDRVNELSALQRLLTRDAWQNYQHSQVEGSYLFDPKQGWVETGEVASFKTQALMVRGEVIGHLGVDDDGDMPLSADEHELLEAISLQVAEALDNARLVAQTRKRAIELEAVAQVSTIASSVLEVHKLLDTVVTLTKARFHLYHVHIYLLHESTHMLELVAGAGEVGRQLVEARWQVALGDPDSIVAQAVLTRSGVLVNDVQAMPHFVPNSLLPDTRGELAVPIISGDKVLGVLDVQSDRPNIFSAEDVRIQGILAAQIAVALQNAKLYQETRQVATQLEQQAQRLAGLNELGLELTSIRSLTQILDIVARRTRQIIASDRVTILFLDETGTTLTYMAWQGRSEPEISAPIPVTQSLAQHVIQTKRLWAISDVTQINAVGAWRMAAQGVRAGLLVPLIVGNQVIGTLNVWHREANKYSTIDENLVQQIASLLATMVENQRLFDEAQKRATDLEKLARLEAHLALAVTEAEILDAIAFAIQSEPNPDIFLNYIELTDNGQPGRVVIHGLWTQGQWQIEAQGQVVCTLNDMVALPGWMQHPDQLYFEPQVTASMSVAECGGVPHSRVASLALLPLFIGGVWQGVMGFAWSQPHVLSLEERFVLGKLIEPVGAIVANRRAQLAQQEARRQSETLYQLSRLLSLARDETELLMVLGQPARESGATATTLLYMDSDEQGQPEWLEVAATWRGDNNPKRQIGRRSLVGNLITNRLWLARPTEPLCIRDILHDVELDDISRQYFLTHQIMASVVIPIQQAGRWMGLLTFDWAEPHEFSPYEMTVYRALVGLAAPAIASRRDYLQLEVARLRAETVARISTAMSLATTEQELLRALTLELPPSYRASTIVLNYLHEDAQGVVIASEIAAIQTGGGQEIPLVGLPQTYFTVAETPTVNLVLDSPHRPIFVENVLTDERYDDKVREFFKLVNVKGLLLMPLKTGEHWYGIISLTWATPRVFEPNMQAMFIALTPRTADLMASRRAQIAQKVALAETEALYAGSNQIVRATTRDELLLALVQSTVLAQLDRAFLLLFNHTFEHTPPETMQVIASWKRPELPQLAGLEMLYRFQDFPSIHQLREKPIWVADLTGDMEMDANFIQVVGQTIGLRGIILFPLVAGGQWIGFVCAGVISKPLQLSDLEIRQISSLTDQVAAVLQNQLLFDQMQRTLGLTQKLYEAGRRLNKVSNDLQAAMEAVFKAQAIPAVNRGVMFLIEWSKGGEMLGGHVAANWYSGEGTPPTPIGRKYTPQMVQSFNLLVSPEMEIFNDVMEVDGLDPITRQILEQQHIRSMVALPLSVGWRQLGTVLLQTEERHYFTAEELEPYIALADSLALVVDRNHLLNQAEMRARRERQVREITDKIRRTVGHEAILRTAHEQIGQLLEATPVLLELGTSDILLK